MLLEGVSGDHKCLGWTPYCGRGHMANLSLCRSGGVLGWNG